MKFKTWHTVAGLVIALATLLIGLGVPFVGWMNAVAGDTSRIATAMEFFKSSQEKDQREIKEFGGLSSRNSERINGVEKRVDDHQRQLERVNPRKQ